MAFTEILGLGLSAVGMIQANSQHKQAQRARERELEAMRKQQSFMNYMGMQAQDDVAAENARIEEIEQMNRLIAQQERQFQIDMMMENRGLVDEQRQYQIDRQVEQDREAARVQAMQIEQLLRNQSIRQEERAFAEQQLAQYQEIARGEREDDMRQFYEARAQKQAEREFAVEHYGQAIEEGRLRQSREQSMYDRILGQVGGMQTAIRMAASDLGEMPDAPRMTKADLDSEISRRQEAYQSDVDRAADRVASQGEANLIRAGLDASTPGISKRGDITRRIADEYQSARDRAYDDALKYITGQQDMLMSGYNSEVARRGDVLSEVAGVAGTGLEQLGSMPGVADLSSLLMQAGQMPSAAYDRGIVSAAVDPRIAESGVYEGSIGSGMSNYDVDAWDYGNDWAYLDSAIRGTEGRQIADPNAYFTSQANMAGNLYDAANADADYARKNRDYASGTLFKDITDFTQNSPGLNDWWNDTKLGSWLGGSSKNAPRKSPRPRPRPI